MTNSLGVSLRSPKKGEAVCIRSVERGLASRLEEIPTRQFTSAKDVAGLVYYLLFESDNINGQSINVDGGWYFG